MAELQYISQNGKLNITRDGNVGIGTASPGALLEVFGTGNSFRLDSAANGSKEILFRNVGTGTATIKTDGDLKLYTEDANKNILFETTGGEKMRIEAGGNVGIGTTSPDYKLDVSAAARAHGVRIGRDFSIASRGTVRIDANGTGSPSDVLFGHTAAANESSWTGVYWSLSSRGTSDNGKFQLWRGSGHAAPYNSELRVLTALPNGNIGIGETSPDYPLTVSGLAQVAGALRITETGTAQRILMGNQDSSGVNNPSIIEAANGNLYFGNGDSWNGEGGTHSIKMTVLDGGNVGIGTTGPQYQLDLGKVNDSAQSDFIRLGVNNGGVGGDTNSFGSGIIWKPNYTNYTKRSAGIVQIGEGHYFRSGLAFYTNNSANTTGDWGERMRIDMDGNVGIGTTDPDHTLMLEKDVHGEWGALRLFNYHSDGSTVGSVAINMDVRASNGQIARASIKSRESTADSPYSELGFFTSNTTSTTPSERMTIDKDGNVGIGDTGPAVKLQVSTNSPTNNVAALIGDGWVGNSSYHKEGGLLLISGTSQDTTQTGAGIAFQTRNTANTNYWKSSMIMDRDGAIRFTLGGAGTTAGSEDFTILSGGYVGIGTTSPGAALQIYNGLKLNQNGTLQWGNSGDQGILTWDTSRVIVKGSSGNELHLGANNSNSNIVINSAGNVGIGTTVPQKRLEAISVANDFLSVGVAQMGVGQWAGIHFGYRESNLLYRKSAIVFERTDLTANNAQGKIHILNGPQGGAGSATLADAKLTIAENGNVGIGTISPGAKLHVVGTSNFQGNIQVSGGTFVDSTRRNIYLNSFDGGDGNGIFFRDGFTYNASITVEDHNGSSADGICISGYDGVSFSTGANSKNERMRIATNGNVGIGTTSPTNPLHVQKDAGGNAIAYFNSLNTDGYGVAIRTADTGNDKYVLRLDSNSGSTPVMYATNAGNVGIGTTNPGYKLDVNGPIRATGTSQVNHLNCSSTLSFGLFTSGVRGTIFEGYSTHSVVRTDAARLDFYMGKTTTGVGTMMSLTDTGRVGIGTTNPLHKLEVSGNLRVTSYGSFLNYVSATGFRLEPNQTIMFDNGEDGFCYIKAEDSSFNMEYYSAQDHYFKSGEDSSYTDIYANNFILGSDARIKENVNNLDIKPINAGWKSFNIITKKEDYRVGVIAQELEENHPEFVNTDDEGFKTVKYIDLLIAKIAELEARLEKLEK